MTELMKVNLAEYGVDETKAKDVKKDFDAVLKIAVELEDRYNEIVAKDVITDDLCKEAKELRLKYVKVRTGIAAVHKERKAYYLSGGRAIDGLKNAYTHAVEGNEGKLKEIETHFERIEEERLKALQSERAGRLSKYVEDANERDLVKFANDEFEALLQMKKNQYEEEQQAIRKAEEERIAKEKAEAEEQERIRIENAKLKAEAEAQAKALQAERAERERIEAEAKAKADSESKEKAELAKREANQAHRKRINNEALECLLSNIDGLTDDHAKSVIIAIGKGQIKHVSINY